MSKSAFSAAHQLLVKGLTQAREAAGLHQADLAKKIGKNQSYISNIERGQRRVDVIEFIVIVEAMNGDPVRMFSEVVSGMPDEVAI
ncbi:transcriptional regulator with XRE-family HTH domain [Sphingopyxis panaciterrae]|uniref:helix-turn-helix domain-containing protein n=1 Tax=Sphingopyxis panaciterrae TaxID=363841 RepID=UPI001421AFC3|nr:helix-turn-helix transcriptional regulator [Sphingopyxis panaciterrae]NIJ39252.1 transcriptional regulator with XRE-family HTH domain [Sphingopyxis panaciterrae]